ncbi:chloride channel protein [Clostridium aestuarii]|uniref:Chloride channel protein n=1 Tax=Clostridium aestuarii TaxID=338193 RepID=A0ABT4D3U3_9CLOT|nr:chloride channel protein [Clostridium aestuarii]MCY6484925.1 chloride channel protein [Clostridium aestuarii]
MKKNSELDWLEEYVLLGSAIKWIILSIFVGVTVGTATALFIKVVNIGVSYTSKWTNYYLLIPLAFMLSSFLVFKLAPDAEGHGTEKAIEAIHKKAGRMDIKVIPVKLITTFITIIFGGSVGEEGPATQIGAGIASFFAGILKMDDMDRKRFAVCGISAGFVGVFGAPIGAAAFASEVLYIGRFSYISLLPSFLASFVSYYIGQYLGTKPLMYSVYFTKKAPTTMFLKMIIFGIFIGIIANIFIAVVNWIEEFFKNLKAPRLLKPIIGGCMVLLITFITKSTDYLGIGESFIEKSIAGDNVSGIAFLAKMFTTSFTLGSGGSGGILTPMLYIGATAGSAWSSLIHASASFYAAVGMVTFLAACANTPLAGIIIATELFGAQVGTYAAIVTVISYLIVGHRSIYPTQVISTVKSPSIDLATDCEINKIRKIKFNAKYKPMKKFINNHLK